MELKLIGGKFDGMNVRVREDQLISTIICPRKKDLNESKYLYGTTMAAYWQERAAWEHHKYVKQDNGDFVFDSMTHKIG